MELIATLKFFKITLKHKWFVFQAGLKLRVSFWRLIKHDCSKFLLSEMPYYGKQFYGSANDEKGYIKCWLKHQNRNDHHWEYWIPRSGHYKCNPPYPNNEPIPMPEQCLREMISDWMGAGKAYEGKWPDINNWTWFENNKDKIRLHEETRKLLYKIIDGMRNKNG